MSGVDNQEPMVLWGYATNANGLAGCPFDSAVLGNPVGEGPAHMIKRPILISQSEAEQRGFKVGPDGKLARAGAAHRAAQGPKAPTATR